MTDAVIATVHQGKTEVWGDERLDCPICGGKRTVAPIPPLHLARIQAQAGDDGTTHVCHPGPGGCNQGFEAGP